MKHASLISLGKIVKVQGLKGEFRVYPHSLDSATLGRQVPIVIAPAAGEPLETHIIRSRQKGSVYILQVQGVTDVDQARRLVGAEVFVDEQWIEPPSEDEFYWYEVIGMDVVTDQGERLGVIESIIATGANDVLQVKNGKREILLPNIPDVVLEIDRDAGRILVHLLPGLVD